MIELTNYPISKHQMGSYQRPFEMFITDISSIQWNKKATCATVCDQIVYDNSKFDVIDENGSRYFASKDITSLSNIQAKRFAIQYNKIGIPAYRIYIATNCHRPTVKFHHDWTKEDWNLAKSEKPDHAWFEFTIYQNLSSMSAIYKNGGYNRCNGFDFMLNVTFDGAIAK